MDIREQIRRKSATARREELVTLPITGVQILVIGMMLGDRLRVYDCGKEMSKTLPLQVALTSFDPETRAQLWNPNDLNDMNEIKGLPPEDSDALMEVSMRLSGMGKDAGKASPASANSPSSSASDLESVLPSSES